MRRVLWLTLLGLLFVGCDNGDSIEIPDIGAARDVASVADVGAAVDAGAVEDTVTTTDSVASTDAAADSIADTGPQGIPWDELTAQGPTIREMIGVSTHMYQGMEENAHRDFEFERYVELGGVRIREDYHWHHVEPQDDQWNFDRVRGQVNAAQAAGTPITAMLGYGVDWAQPEGTDDEIDPAEWGEFVGALATEYCDEVDSWEVWNEQNIGRFWQPVPNSTTYTGLLKASAESIRAACPGAKIVIGGLASYSELDMFNYYVFLERMWEADPNVCDYFDVLAIHPYTWTQLPPPENDALWAPGLIAKGQTLQTEQARERLMTIGCPDRPIWYTEAGWPSYDLTEEQQGLYLARSVMLAARDGVEAYFWYTFWDSYPKTEGVRPHEAYFGLFGWRGDDGSNRRVKSSWLAYKGLVDRLGSSRLARDLSPELGLPNDVYVLAFLDEQGVINLAAWDGRDDPDVTAEGTQPGGPDTTHDLTLPLPDGVSSIFRYDISGNEVEAPASTTELHLALTPSMQYVKITR